MAKSAAIQMGLMDVSRPDSSRTQPLWKRFQPGLMCELSGQGRGAAPSSVAARLVVQAQAEGEPVAWVAPREGTTVYPPDLAAVGVDLQSLVFVRVPGEQKAGAHKVGHGLVRACEVLLRSGAFGLVVLDLSEGVPARPLVWQARLNGLVRLHEARLAMITGSEQGQASLGPLVSLRVEGQLERSGERALLAHRVLKSKLGGQVALSPEVRCVPEGAEAARVLSDLVSLPVAEPSASPVSNEPAGRPLPSILPDDGEAPAAQQHSA